MCHHEYLNDIVQVEVLLRQIGFSRFIHYINHVDVAKVKGERHSDTHHHQSALTKNTTPDNI